MSSELRLPDPLNVNTTYVVKVKNGGFDFSTEERHTTGEIAKSESETEETITIKRKNITNLTAL